MVTPRSSVWRAACLRVSHGVVLSSVLLGSGCALFPAAEWGTHQTASKAMLPPLRVAPDAIQLEVVLLERWCDDPLLTREVWQEVSQLGTISAEDRNRLKANGLRVGQIGATPPPSVQNLLGIGAGNSSWDTDANQVTGRRLSLQSGNETEISLSDPRDECQIAFRSDQKSETETFQLARCVMRVRPSRLQEGWSRIEFTPEIHHGDARLRPAATEQGWAYQNGQKTNARHELRFDVKLNVGEFALVTADPEVLGSWGEQAFVHEQNGRRKQRVLLVRLTDLGTAREAGLYPGNP